MFSIFDRVNQNRNNRETVYVTNTGKLYHLEHCGYLRSCNPIPLEDVLTKWKFKYDPCSRCKPPTTLRESGSPGDTRESSVINPVNESFSSNSKSSYSISREVNDFSRQVSQVQNQSRRDSQSSLESLCHQNPFNEQIGKFVDSSPFLSFTSNNLNNPSVNKQNLSDSQLETRLKEYVDKRIDNLEKESEAKVSSLKAELDIIKSALDESRTQITQKDQRIRELTDTVNFLLNKNIELVQINSQSQRHFLHLIDSSVKGLVNIQKKTSEKLFQIERSVETQRVENSVKIDMLEKMFTQVLLSRINEKRVKEHSQSKKKRRIFRKRFNHGKKVISSDEKGEDIQIESGQISINLPVEMEKKENSLNGKLFSRAFMNKIQNKLLPAYFLNPLSFANTRLKTRNLQS